jgi:hypothetical protein
VVVEAFVYERLKPRAVRALVEAADELGRFLGKPSDLRSTVI